MLWSLQNSHFKNLKRTRFKKPFQILLILLLKLSLSATLILSLVLRNNFFDYTTNAFYFAFFAKQLYGIHKNRQHENLWKPFPQYYCPCPETARLFSLKSIVPEQEGCTFWTLRILSENTTNRQPKYVVDNAMIRIQFQAFHSDHTQTIAKQNSTISKQAKLLPPQKRTLLNSTLLKKCPLLVQNHLVRIPDSSFLIEISGGRWMLRAWLSKMVQARTITDQRDRSCTTSSQFHWKKR